ncbi:GLPGLI family protein [Aquimarina sp. RZ0]|uniref:GLPGLI family protein n=1 Tax=Aquimarina sp. RZ0 TaxID=2607730 RepID=UPI0011F12D91|nr:GLPGLI family protein [Aquimarina sp. RZ0]KAA1244591.1 GLPGLI family protein [Aquimarina sp. RZ0]
MKKQIVILFSLLICFSMLSQVSYKIDYEFTDQHNYTCDSSLYINSDETLFKINDTRETGIKTDESTNDMFFVINDELSRFIYCINSKSHTRIPYRGRELTYEFDSSHLPWSFTGNSKKIGDYNCSEAILDLNGRSYKVWFTSEIPINYGPLKLNGLPGLILEVIVDNNFFHLKMLNIKKVSYPKELNDFKAYFKSKKVLPYKEYESLVIKLMAERKIKKIAQIAELGGLLTYAKDQRSFTKHLIDIPTNLVEELQKIN